MIHAPRNRRAVATIEFVMVFPLLVFMAAGIFLIARAGVGKEAAASGARYKAWAAREDAKPGQIYRLNHDPAESRVSGEHTVRLLTGPLFRGAAFEADSVSFVTDRTWDHTDVPFERRGDFKLHEGPYKLLASNIPAGEVVVTLSAGLALALNPGANPVLLVAAAVGTVGNVLIRVAAVVLKIIGAVVFGPAKLTVAALKLAAQFSFHFKLARRLGRVLDLLNLASRSFDNLDRASRGLAVDNPGGLGSLRVP